MKSILTTSEVAKLLGLHPNTLKNWVRDGRLPSYRTLGGHYRIRVCDLLTVLHDKNIPIPAELEKFKKEVYVAACSEDLRNALVRDLATLDSVNVRVFHSGVEALIVIGTHSPDVLIWDTASEDVSLSALAKVFADKQLLHDTDLVLVQKSGDSELMELPGGFNDMPLYRYPENLSNILSIAGDEK
jgi:excisionase family DNA binding protein